jgi:hypothetical protein
MNEAEIAECFASVLDDSGSLDIADLLESGRPRKEVAQNRSTDKETSGAAGG